MVVKECIYSKLLLCKLFAVSTTAGSSLFQRNFCARIKFQMVRQRIRVRIVYWWYVPRQSFAREADSSYNTFSGKTAGGGWGGGGAGEGGYMP